jgi:sugar lactone lactonase YvrE
MASSCWARDPSGRLGRSERNVPHLAGIVSVICLAALVAGCEAPRAETPVATGSLDVTVSTGSGAAGVVVIRGPDAFHQDLSASAVLTHLASGPYTVTADPISALDSIVGTDVDTAAVGGSPATVSSGDTVPVAVSYDVESSTGGLWVANYAAGSVLEMGTRVLGRTGSPEATTALGFLGGPSVMALDSSGNLWVALYDSAAIVMYTPAQRASGVMSSPAITLRGSGIISPNGLAFDLRGNLWICNQLPASVVEFGASQLTSSGAPTPAVTVTGPPLDRPEGIAFDANGTAWVANLGTDAILGYNVDQLIAGGTVAPADTLDATGGSLSHPVALAWDHAGDLWVANNLGGTIVEFTPSQLAAGGAPPPAVTIALPEPGAAPWGLAFDHHGALWVADLAVGWVYEYAPEQLITSGQRAPAVSLGLPSAAGGAAPEGIVLDSDAPGGTPSSWSSRRGRLVPRAARRSSLR